jgi:allene oxide cyclase
MKRVVSLVVPLGAVILLIVAVSAWASPPQHRGGGDRHRGDGRTITVIEHATTDATTDTGASGDSAGDILTFANDLFDAADATKVGTDQGYCIRVVVGAGASYECTWTAFLADGQIVVNGPFFDAKGSTLAITGGTGRYRGARGEMELESRENGTKFAFTYHLKG